MSTVLKSRGAEADPLADFWTEFMMNPWIATPGSIRVRYLGDWKWSFEVPGPHSEDENLTPFATKAALRSWLGQLLTRMGKSLSYEN